MFTPDDTATYPGSAITQFSDFQKILKVTTNGYAFSQCLIRQRLFHTLFTTTETSYTPNQLNFSHRHCLVSINLFQRSVNVSEYNNLYGSEFKNTILLRTYVHVR